MFSAGNELTWGLARRGLAGALAVAALALVGCGAAAGSGRTSGPGGASPVSRAGAANPDLDPGTSVIGKPAPGFRLVNQFGQSMSLAQFRGKVVFLAFIDSRCTNVCPLTAQAMLEARQLLGAAGSRVQLLGVDANPRATSVGDMLAFSRAHGMVNHWDLLTGSPAQLHEMWKAYHIAVEIQRGLIDHTPALYVIGQRGREQKIYLTQMAYASIGQQAQVLAREAASLLPGHPPLTRNGSLAYIRGQGPKTKVRLPALPSGTLTLAPGRPRLVLFFATWLTETSDLRDHLLALNGYAQAAKRHRLPSLAAVDEASTEPSAAAVRGYLRRLGRPLRYPVGLDATGRVADGYGVQDQPWFTLVSAAGKIVWSHDGWLPVKALEAAARRA